MAVSSATQIPTELEYNALQGAFDVMNNELFMGRLPHVLITLQRSNRCLGYYSANRFTQQSNSRVAEIALNPSAFGCRSVLCTLSTLAHELCHHAQFTTAKKRLPAYHDAEFAAIMLQIGLQTSTTGAPYGLPTGQSMSHYIISGGRFLTVAKQLIADGFELPYSDVVGMPGGYSELIIGPPLSALPKQTNEGKKTVRAAVSMLVYTPSHLSKEPGEACVDDGEVPSGNDAKAPDAPSMVNAGSEEASQLIRSALASATRTVSPLVASEPCELIDIETPSGEIVQITRVGKDPTRKTVERETATTTRSKYRCPGCSAQVWGKPGLQLVCKPCQASFITVV